MAELGAIRELLVRVDSRCEALVKRERAPKSERPAPVAEVKTVAPADVALLKSATGADRPDPIKPATPAPTTGKGAKRGGK
jgi:hypothetical protein